MEEVREPMRGLAEAPKETELFVSSEVFYEIKDLFNRYGIEGISVWACDELFRGSIEAITYQAIKDAKTLSSEILEVLKNSAKITKEEERKIITLWDVRRIFRRLFVCPYPWCRKQKE